MIYMKFDSIAILQYWTNGFAEIEIEIGSGELIFSKYPEKVTFFLIISKQGCVFCILLYGKIKVIEFYKICYLNL